MSKCLMIIWKLLRAVWWIGLVFWLLAHTSRIRIWGTGKLMVHNFDLVTCDVWHVTCDMWRVTCDEYSAFAQFRTQTTQVSIEKNPYHNYFFSYRFPTSVRNVPDLKRDNFFFSTPDVWYVTFGKKNSINFWYEHRPLKTFLENGPPLTSPKLP